MKVIFLLVIFIGIILYEVPYLIRKKMWKELITFFMLLTGGFILNLLLVIGIKMPNPTTLVETIFGFIK